MRRARDASRCFSAKQKYAQAKACYSEKQDTRSGNYPDGAQPKIGLTFPSERIILMASGNIPSNRTTKEEISITAKHTALFIGFAVMLVSLMVCGCAEKDPEMQISGMVQSLSAYDNSLGQDYQVNVVITNVGDNAIFVEDIWVMFDATGHEEDYFMMIADGRNETIAPGRSITGSYESTGGTQGLFDDSKNGNVGFSIGVGSGEDIIFNAAAILPRLGDKNGHGQEMGVGDTALLVFADNQAVTDALNV